jgi:hypothetical protein
MKWIIILLLFLIGCQPDVVTKVDGLYINGTLVKDNATVEDFCKAQGEHISLHRHGKDIYSISHRGEL